MAKLLVTTNRLLRSASSVTSELAVTGYFSSVRAGAQVTGDTKLVGATSSGGVTAEVQAPAFMARLR